MAGRGPVGQGTAGPGLARLSKARQGFGINNYLIDHCQARRGGAGRG